MPKKTARVVFYMTYIVILHFGLLALGAVSDLKLLLAFFASGIRDIEKLDVYANYDYMLVILWYACGVFLLYIIWMFFSIQLQEKYEDTSMYNQIFEIINKPATMGCVLICQLSALIVLVFVIIGRIWTMI